MKRNKLPPTISLQYLINEVKKQEHRDIKIKCFNSDSDEILQLGQKDI